MADACPNWGDKAPLGKLPKVLGPWLLWDQDEEQLETRSAGAEMEAEMELCTMRMVAAGFASDEATVLTRIAVSLQSWYRKSGLVLCGGMEIRLHLELFTGQAPLSLGILSGHLPG